MTSTETNITEPTLSTNEPTLTGPIKTLKDAFSDLDLEIIETIYETQGHNLDSAFEVLLNMSDPEYKPDPSSHFDQVRQDEEYARQLARDAQQQYQSQQRQQQQQQEEEPLFNFQEELPIIKEKVIEAGTAAKNKLVGFYNQFMANRSDGSSDMGSASMNNNYQAGYTQQPQRQYQQQQQQQRNNVDLYEWDGQPNNPLLAESNDKDIVTSTPSAQLLADEELARQLAREEDGYSAEPLVEPFIVPREVNDDNSANHEEVTFTTPDKPIETEHITTPPLATTPPTTTATIPNKPNHVVDDDLDDLFDKKIDLNDDGVDKTK